MVVTAMTVERSATTCNESIRVTEAVARDRRRCRLRLFGGQLGRQCFFVTTPLIFARKLEGTLRTQLADRLDLVPMKEDSQPVKVSPNHVGAFAIDGGGDHGDIGTGQQRLDHVA